MRLIFWSCSIHPFEVKTIIFWLRWKSYVGFFVAITATQLKILLGFLNLLVFGVIKLTKNKDN